MNKLFLLLFFIQLNYAWSQSTDTRTFYSNKYLASSEYLPPSNIDVQRIKPTLANSENLLVANSQDPTTGVYSGYGLRINNSGGLLAAKVYTSPQSSTIATRFYDGVQINDINENREIFFVGSHKGVSLKGLIVKCDPNTLQPIWTKVYTSPYPEDYKAMTFKSVVFDPQSGYLAVAGEVQENTVNADRKPILLLIDPSNGNIIDNRTYFPQETVAGAYSYDVRRIIIKPGFITVGSRYVILHNRNRWVSGSLTAMGFGLISVDCSNLSTTKCFSYNGALDLREPTVDKIPIATHITNYKHYDEFTINQAESFIISGTIKSGTPTAWRSGAFYCKINGSFDTYTVTWSHYIRACNTQEYTHGGHTETADGNIVLVGQKKLREPYASDPIYGYPNHTLYGTINKVTNPEIENRYCFMWQWTYRHRDTRISGPTHQLDEYEPFVDILSRTYFGSPLTDELRVVGNSRSYYSEFSGASGCVEFLDTDGTGRQGSEQRAWDAYGPVCGDYTFEYESDPSECYYRGDFWDNNFHSWCENCAEYNIAQVEVEWLGLEGAEAETEYLAGVDKAVVHNCENYLGLAEGNNDPSTLYVAQKDEIKIGDLVLKNTSLAPNFKTTSVNNDNETGHSITGCFKVFDINGAEVISQDLDKMSIVEAKNAIVNTLSTGIYFIVFSNADGRYVSKLSVIK